MPGRLEVRWPATRNVLLLRARCVPAVEAITAGGWQCRARVVCVVQDVGRHYVPPWRAAYRALPAEPVVPSIWVGYASHPRTVYTAR